MGTVVTGTLLEGKLSVDQQVAIEPSGVTTRIRNLQTHKHKLAEATPGSRVAINLAGIEKSSVDRGEAVCTPGSILPSLYLAAELSLLGGAKSALRNGFEIAFLLGTADVLGRVYFLDSEMLKPGQKAFVKIRLNAPVTAKLGDRFIVRRISPQDTIGGGIVLDTEFAGSNKNKGLQKDILQRRLSLNAESIILTELDKSFKTLISKLFLNIPFERKVMETALKACQDRGDLVVFGDSILSKKFLAKYADPAMEILESDHALRSWSDGVEPGSIAKKLKLDPYELPAMIDYLVSTGKVAHEKGFLKLIGHQAQLKPDQLRLQGRLNARLSAGPLSAPTRKEFIDEDPQYEVVINFLRDKGEIIELKGGILFTRRDFDNITAKLTEYLNQVKQATASDIKTYLKTSRKYIIPILEKFDSLGVTKRNGDYRSLAK
jgi:selenocysteine-specific elongation factor